MPTVAQFGDILQRSAEQSADSEGKSIDIIRNSTRLQVEKDLKVTNAYGEKVTTAREAEYCMLYE